MVTQNNFYSRMEGIQMDLRAARQRVRYYYAQTRLNPGKDNAQTIHEQIDLQNKLIDRLQKQLAALY